MDKRTNRIQPIRLSQKFFPLDIHKSMFINDLMITIPQYYVESWGDTIISKHTKTNRFWKVKINYQSPKKMNNIINSFDGKLSLFFAKGRAKTSSYRLKWDKQFAVQLAKDYPKSFVRSLEFHIGDSFYKEKAYTEFDIGGFKEQLQVQIKWINGVPEIRIKEFFRVREESQVFPKVFEYLSSYLIADYLLSDEKEILRRIQIGEWKPRRELVKEIKENSIYLLINRNKKQLYIGETKQALSQRYPDGQQHHSFDDWTEYTIIQLPPETSDHTRFLIERVLIATSTKLFANNLIDGSSFFNKENGLLLMNKKK